MSLNVFSYGGGKQSTAVLVLAAQGRLHFDALLFANVGKDSEKKPTLRYYYEVAKPFAQEHGLNLIELHRVMRDGSTRTLREEIDQQPRSIPIPVRMPGGNFGRRRCTDRFKIAVVAKWTKEHGATEDAPARVGIGFSIDEPDRLTNRKVIAWEDRYYPLVEMRLTRADCIRIVADAGLPPAPRSACYFCPFQNTEEWRALANDNPEDFQDAVRLEQQMDNRWRALGHTDHVRFSPAATLPRVLDQQSFFTDEGATCDAGGCFT